MANAARASEAPETWRQWLSDSGALYDPATDTWASTSSKGAPVPRYRAGSAWTGATLIVWGGLGGPVSAPEDIGGDLPLASGGVYDAATDTWTAMTDSPLAGRSGHTAIWTGDAFFVWGGEATSALFGDGALYYP
jgi:hypothetical protein